MTLKYEAIKEMLESLAYHDIHMCIDEKITALNLFDEERLFEVVPREKKPIEKYVVKSINNEFMKFENADKISYIEVEFTEEKNGKVDYICVLKDFLYNKTPAEMKLVEKYLGITL